MKYTKHHFSSGMKINLADVLNRMEDGIAAACGAAVEGIGTVTTGDTPAAGIRDGKLCLTLPRGEPGPQGDPGEGLSDNAKALLLSLLADTAPDTRCPAGGVGLRRAGRHHPRGRRRRRGGAVNGAGKRKYIHLYPGGVGGFNRHS